MDGILTIAKPAGWTSHDVVARLRRVLHERRIGHAGTLDPAATGVLVVCVGQATRVVDYLMDSPKHYQTVIEFGTTTTTDDAEGEVVARHDALHVRREDLEALLRRFVGPIRQRPPVYSALKVSGRPMYKLARKGIAPEPEEREVVVYGISISDWQPPRVGLDIDCGRGTYIRSLARDLGAALGVGGHMATLARTRVGRFRVEDAFGIDEVASVAEAGGISQLLAPLDEALLGLDAIIVGPEGERQLRNGATYSPTTVLRRPAEGTRCRVYSLAGEIVGIANYSATADAWQPRVVFAPAPAQPQSPELPSE